MTYANCHFTLPGRAILCSIVVFIGFMLFHPVGADGAGPEKRDSQVQVVITVHQTARVKGEKIKLKHIAEIRAAGYMANRLGEMKVADAPKPGADKIMTGKWISSRIQSINWLPDETVIIVPETVQIQRLYQLLSRERMEKMFRDYIDGRMAGEEYSINKVRVRGKTKVPLGRLDFEFMGKEPGPIAGRVKMGVMIRVDGHEAGRITLSCWVDRYEMVACARHLLPRGSVLTQDDVEMKPINTSRTPVNLIRVSGDAVGMRLKKTLRPGDHLRENMLEPLPLIQKGERVKLVAKGGLLTIVTNGVAKASGGKGEQIKVENISSKKMVVGRVKDQSTVEVLF